MEYKDEYETRKDVKKVTEKQEISVPDPSLFKKWKKYPWFTLQNYCEHYGIHLSIEDEGNNTVLTVGKEKFYTNNEEYTHSGFRYKRDWEIKEELAKFYYQRKIEPILKKQQRQARDNTPAEALRNFILAKWERLPDKAAWKAHLDMFCAQAHLPLSEIVEAAIVKEGKENKCRLPNKLDMKGWRDDEIRVMYLKMAGIEGKIRGEGKEFRDARDDAAKNCLHLIWYDLQITNAQEDGNDKMVEFYTSQKQKLKEKCLVETLAQEQQPQKQQDLNSSLELLKAKFNRDHAGQK